MACVSLWEGMCWIVVIQTHRCCCLVYTYTIVWILPDRVCFGVSRRMCSSQTWGCMLERGYSAFVLRSCEFFCQFLHIWVVSYSACYNNMNLKYCMTMLYTVPSTTGSHRNGLPVPFFLDKRHCVTKFFLNRNVVLVHFHLKIALILFIRNDICLER